MVEKIFVHWEEFHQDVKHLANKIKKENIKYNKIIAVSRGGLVPAGILAYELDISNCHSINVSTYSNYTQNKVEKLEIVEDLGIVDENTLVVDDLSDTGQTFRLLRNRFPQARFVAVYSKPAGLEAVDVYAREFPDNWIVFPWD